MPSESTCQPDSPANIESEELVWNQPHQPVNDVSFASVGRICVTLASQFLRTAITHHLPNVAIEITKTGEPLTLPLVGVHLIDSSPHLVLHELQRFDANRNDYDAGPRAAHISDRHFGAKFIT